MDGALLNVDGALLNVDGALDGALPGTTPVGFNVSPLMEGGEDGPPLNIEG